MSRKVTLDIWEWRALAIILMLCAALLMLVIDKAVSIAKQSSNEIVDTLYLPQPCTMCVDTCENTLYFIRGGIADTACYDSLIIRPREDIQGELILNSGGEDE